MSRRIDYETAERVSIALLTREAFGTESGMRTALLMGLPVALAEAVFQRDHPHIRIDGSGSRIKADRRGLHRHPHHPKDH